MSIPCDKTFMLVPRSRSSVKIKVKYQGHSFRKKIRGGGGGIGVSQTHLVFNLCCYNPADSMDENRTACFVWLDLGLHLSRGYERRLKE